MTEQRLLIVDDREDNLDSLKLGFDRLPYQLVTATGGKRALEIIRDEPPFDVIITDLMMPEVDGMEVLKASLTQCQKTAVIILTAFGSIERAVEALREGAYHFLTKPVSIEELRREVKRAMERSGLLKTNENLQRAVEERYGFDGIIGNSSALFRVFDQVRQVADTRATVLLEGESGTGKELFSKATHFNSDRARKPFLPVHCAALAESLLESELFGHEKGSFTGAINKKLGLFELANGGTLFLDEVGEIPLSVQVKLLRVLETKEFVRVGGIEPVKIDVRVITATNRNLEDEVKEGRFREDLFYRLKVIHITIPTLRDRREDIPLLIDHFLDELAGEHGRTRPELSNRALEKLIQHEWPGNIRELRNSLESLLLFCKNGIIDLVDLPQHLGGTSSDYTSLSLEPGISLGEMENRMIRKTLDDTGQNRTQAAQILGISRRTLQRKLKELGID